MKKFLNLLIICAACFSSCNIEDQLDIPQQGVLAVEETYTTADDEGVLSFITAIYSKVFGNHLDALGWTDYGTGVYSIKTHLDNMGGDLSTYWSYTETAESSQYQLMWSYYYSNIYACNLALEYLPQNTVASPEVIEQVISEARAIRAIMMMYLVQLWGTPPLADHIMQGDEGNTPAAESWSFIESELSAAALGLPSKSNVNGQNQIGGRITKEAAYAYLGKAYLWQKKYTEAASVLYDKVISTNLYELEDNFEDLNSSAADFGPEYLWEYEFTDDPTYATSQNGAFVVTFNWSNASINYPDEIYSGQGWGLGAYASESFGSFMEQYSGSSVNTSGSRYKGTIATYEELLSDQDRFTYSSGSKGITSTAVVNCEGYFRVRLIPRVENVMGSGFWYYNYIHNDFCFMRYAEVLLNYAEAVAMGGTPGAISGLEALNIVRRRAGLSDASTLDMDDENYGVKAERRAELFYEGCRFIDLVRWGEAASTLSDVGKSTVTFYGYEDGRNDVVQTKADWKVQSQTTISKGFVTNKNELFPIPLVEISNNLNLTQNPGW